VIVQARQFKSMSSLERYIRNLEARGVADRYYDLPMPSTTKAWLGRGGIPSSPNMAKVFMLALTPVNKYPYRGFELAEKVANLLEERHGALNDWACGKQPGKSLCLFIKPWGSLLDSGKRVWFRPDAGDMEVIRQLDKAYRTKPKRMARDRRRR